MVSILSIKSIIQLPENRNVASETVWGMYGMYGKDGKWKTPCKTGVQNEGDRCPK